MVAHSATVYVLLACAVLVLVAPLGHSQNVGRAQRGLKKRLERMPPKDVPFAPASNVVRLEKAVAVDPEASSSPSGPTGPTSGPTGPTSGPTGPTGPSSGPTGPTGPSSGPSGPSTGASPTPTPGPGGEESPGSPSSGISPLYSSGYYDTPPQYGGDLWYQHYWFWALVALVFLACTGLILACVLKSCLCQKKKSMKYIAPTKTYGTNTPVTDKHRAEMEAKYGKFSAY